VWVDQLLSPESLRSTGYFNPAAVTRQRAWQVAIPRITPARFVYDVGLTCVVSTQLWHHLFCGGGLCELPTWQPPARRHAVRAKVVSDTVYERS
jgi:asparagine synthase (glutamine-hydrolysing)